MFVILDSVTGFMFAKSTVTTASGLKATITIANTTVGYRATVHLGARHLSLRREDLLSLAHFIDLSPHAGTTSFQNNSAVYTIKRVNGTLTVLTNNITTLTVPAELEEGFQSLVREGAEFLRHA